MHISCFHCGEPIPKGLSLIVTIDNKPQPMCCVGCEAVAQTIVDNNLTDYYRFRTESAPKGEALIPEQLQKRTLLDEESLQSEFIYQDGQCKEAILTVEGINCAACAWLIEMQINQLSGVVNINVNATTQRATIRWHHSDIKLSEILIAIEKIGYQALPFKASDAEQANQIQSKAFIKRLGISGILMMQVMMIAVGLYFGAFSDMAEHFVVYLRYASLVLTVPIVTYGAFIFYIGAYNALKAKRLSMDVPVSIAIILAFIASAWATIYQTGEVYFESVSMFTFLLLIGKFLEFRARNRAAEVSANLLKLMPMTATKLVNNQEQYVVARKLLPKDIVMIKPGEVIPADGVITQGNSPINEAMLSGEQLPVDKSLGDTVFAGTINGDGNLLVEVKQAGSSSFLSQLIRVSEASQAHKPKIAQLSDTIAQYFVAVILLTAIGTAIYWQQHMPSEAFWITLSVLVATCPCALSLATPTALTCGTTRLNRSGIMIKSSHVMETIPEINTIAFDKTGTLTTGDFDIANIEMLDDSYSKDRVLAYAANLESHSEHPIAKAFTRFRDFSIISEKISIDAGCGISGVIDGKDVKIGKPSWIFSTEVPKALSAFSCIVSINNHPVAAIALIDNIREEAENVIHTLKAKHINTIMLSGDNASGCEKVQQTLQLDSVHSQLTATEKMHTLKAIQHKNTIAMVGDGINDTPVFGAAHVSIAMGSGTEIAKSGADVILLNNRLTSINLLQRVALKTKHIIWQNYGWAFGYNAIVLPLAVCGYITPYMAVIGMSLSSILVITNSLRLLKVK
ncbi:heavy metal translocating P-type ATPase [Thalassotalea sp. 1_MG-2023]|uniref:heavy metal translocating P-type ATPase n=1 Tax=Thalassotalea sp. 1_MG-2023 TaxID=3062680 RepID=UPI0026E2DF32|nr:heavy metal translocating P-type ATPase [Thalassotalea sp. 1_MG-2023]MDO6427783.1 heavy metal translocating P-type ATPase [Thalassotalea sp. 1_MG-2023]